MKGLENIRVVEHYEHGIFMYFYIVCLGWFNYISIIRVLNIEFCNFDEKIKEYNGEVYDLKITFLNKNDANEFKEYLNSIYLTKILIT
jgi:hypothetical protein